MRNEMNWPKWMGENPRANAQWALGEDEELTQEFAEGMTPEQIARRHGRALQGVLSRLERLRLMPTLYCEGKSAQEWRDLLSKANGDAMGLRNTIATLERDSRGLKARIEILKARIEMLEGLIHAPVLRNTIATLGSDNCEPKKDAVHEEVKYQGKTAEEWHTLYYRALDDAETRARGLKEHIAVLEGVIRGVKSKVFAVPA